MNHDFEFFKTRYEGSFFSTVSQFHLPCVRGFYNGDDVKLLPSCISAAMTLVNMDYKYFARKFIACSHKISHMCAFYGALGSPWSL